MPAGRKQPEINPHVARVLSATNNTLNATPSGSTNDAVLRYNAAATITNGAPIAETTTAADGTEIAITEPGIWHFAFTACLTGAAAVFFGISQDVAAAGLTGDPSLATAGMLSIADCLGVASSTIPCTLARAVIVRRTAAFQAGGSVLRCHGTDSAGGAPAAIVAASAHYELQLIAYCGG